MIKLLPTSARVAPRIIPYQQHKTLAQLNVSRIKVQYTIVDRPGSIQGLRNKRSSVNSCRTGGLLDIPCCYMQRERRGEGANRRRSPTRARSPFCPHTPLAERQPEKEIRWWGGDSKKRNCQNCEVLKAVKVQFGKFSGRNWKLVMLNGQSKK